MSASRERLNFPDNNNTMPLNPSNKWHPFQETFVKKHASKVIDVELF